MRPLISIDLRFEAQLHRASSMRAIPDDLLQAINSEDEKILKLSNNAYIRQKGRVWMIDDNVPGGKYRVEKAEKELQVFFKSTENGELGTWLGKATPILAGWCAILAVITPSVKTSIPLFSETTGLDLKPQYHDFIAVCIGMPIVTFLFATLLLAYYVSREPRFILRRVSRFLGGFLHNRMKTIRSWRKNLA